MPTSDRIRIDAPRFWSTVMRSGQIGPGKAGGLRRLALTDADAIVCPTRFQASSSPGAPRPAAR